MASFADRAVHSVRIPVPLVVSAMGAVVVAMLIVGAMHAAAERSERDNLSDALRVAALGVASRPATAADLERLVADPRVGGAAAYHWTGATWEPLLVVAPPGQEPVLEPAVEGARRGPVVLGVGPRMAVWVPGYEDDTVIGVTTEEGWSLGAERRRLRLSAGLLALGTGAIAVATLIASRFVLEPRATPPTPASRRPTDDRGEELGLLGRRYDTLARGMAERSYIRDTLGRYLGDAVAESIGDGHDAVHLPAARLRVAILDVEAVGLAVAADGADPSIALAWVDELNREIVRLVDAEGGRMAVPRPGGGVAVFGAPTEIADAADRALRCGAAIHDRVRALLREWERGRRAPWAVEVHAGVHLAEVVAGNVGTMQRLRYGVVGSAVDRAAEVRRIAHNNGAFVGVSAEARGALAKPVALRPLADTGIFGL